ncbi:BQ5605_C014g07614 [Microbotryum silenes-dioicae]|uniref:Casein kinase II subunit beta n=1 Tax=Microbotryum silenes-dioicae TaxID=796604 RepID=A0A2X0LY27_9BASI|nr:BQ5605_C014g07614 [Microbotryum silenes-dioicae]
MSISTDALPPDSSTVDVDSHLSPTSVDHHGMQPDLPHDDEEEEDEDDELEEDQVEVEVEVEGYESSSSPSTNTSTLTWITWFCSLPGHEYFCEIAEDFIEDDFNLTGLSGLVPFYKEAMEMVLDVEAGEYTPPLDSSHRVPDVSIVESSAELLYGLIHQRYILTRQGLQQMASAFFGTTFPHLLFQTYPSPLNFPPPAPAPNPTDSDPNPTRRELTTPTTSLAKVYVPKIYGFKVSERARSGPRMQWLRMRPKTEGELDWSDDQDDLGLHDDQDDGDEIRRAHGRGGGGGRGKLFGDDDEDEEGGPTNQSEDASDQDVVVEAGEGEGGTTPGEPMQMSGVVVAEKQASLSESVRRHVARAKEEMVRFASGGGAGSANGKVMAVRSTSVGVGA